MDADLVLMCGFWSSPARWDRRISRLRDDADLAGLRIHAFGYESPKMRWPQADRAGHQGQRPIMRFFNAYARGTMSRGMTCARSLAVRCVLIAVGLLVSIAAIVALQSVPASAANSTSVTPYMAAAPATSSPTSRPTSLPSIQTELQQLEVRQLRQQTDRWATVRSWLPAGTALVALIAAAIGILTYLADARKDRRLRLEDKVEENVGILVEYASDPIPRIAL